MWYELILKLNKIRDYENGVKIKIKLKNLYLILQSSLKFITKLTHINLK